MRRAKAPLSVADQLNAVLTEAQWQTQILRLAKSLGWETWHPTIALYSQRGWPDLVLCKPPRLLFWEVKRQSGKVSPEQERWIELLRACGREVAVVRPSDSEWVHAQLMGAVAL